MDSDLKLSVARLSVNRLDLTQQVILDNILSLLNARTGVSKIVNFSLNQVNTIIIIVCIHKNVCHNITVYHVSMK